MKREYKFFFAGLFILICLFAFLLLSEKKSAEQTAPKKEKAKKEEPVVSFADKGPVEIPFMMPEIPEVSFPDRVCPITDYGAIGDGQFMNTKNFAEAIADCAKKGGGKVVVPAGNWLTGPIHLQSNIDLDLQEGSKILFSDKFSDYLPVVFSRFEGTELYNYSPFIYAKNCQNVAITGSGELDGQGKAWLKWNDIQANSVAELYGANVIPEELSIEKLYNMARRGIPVEKRIFGNEQDALQPSFIQFVNCNKILLEGIKIINSPSWTIHLLYSSNMIVRNIEIDTDGRNTDGIVLDSSKNVIIENSTLGAGDDAVVLKSGKDRDGWRIGKPTENIIIHDLKIAKGHSGIALGSEMSGGIKNVLAYNINIQSSDYGIRFKAMRGRGGIVEKIWIKNIFIQRAKSDAIQMDMNYGTPLPDYAKNRPPVFRDININDLECHRAKNVATLTGLSESPLENVTLQNINISSKNGIVSENLKNEKFENVVVETTK